jgi:hypothetical protein
VLLLTEEETCGRLSDTAVKMKSLVRWLAITRNLTDVIGPMAHPSNRGGGHSGQGPLDAVKSLCLRLDSAISHLNERDNLIIGNWGLGWVGGVEEAGNSVWNSVLR